MPDRLPHFESIRVGTGATPALVAGYQYFYFSTPLPDPWELWGFSANFSDTSVKIQMADITDENVWNPFFTTQMGSYFGYLSQAEPILVFAEPYLVRPGARVRIFLQNTSVSNVSQSIITLAGVRLVINEAEAAQCSN